ncbi:MAG: YopX family protein [bacterium]
MGRTDDKGNKLFEDDIVECIHIVKFNGDLIDKRNSKGVIKFNKQYNYFGIGSFELYRAENIKKIGNTHDDPGLLEVK